MATWNPKYKLNLVEIFDRTYANRSKEFRNSLRPTISQEAFKTFFGRSVVDQIVERTLKGVDKNNAVFIAYKKSYTESLIFKIHGKTSKVNLRLSGAMLSSMVNRSSGRYNITIQFADSTQAGKAQGHISGNLGKHTRGRKRDFFGLPKSDEEKVMRATVRLFRDESLNLLAEQDFSPLGLSIETNDGVQDLLLFNEVIDDGEF